MFEYCTAVSTAQGEDRSAGQRRSVALVTGAGGGIGFAVARALLDRGATVLGTYRKDADRARLGATGAQSVPLELENEDSIIELARITADACSGSPFLGLVHCAGAAAIGTWTETDEDVFERLVAANVLGTSRIVRQFMPLLKAHHAALVLLGSLAGRHSTPPIGPYASTQFALRAMADSLRLELRAEGVRVVLVELGPVATGLWEKLRPSAPRYGGFFRSVAEHAIRP
jgi:NAD(P)-dependent dehydrogenase (short-subunit alcohol dehydrogenase family)